MTKYPFTEGEHYFTIEDNTIVESIWDEQSEELYTDKKMYFRTQLEAFYYYRFIRTDEMLDRPALKADLKVTKFDKIIMKSSIFAHQHKIFDKILQLDNISPSDMLYSLSLQSNIE